jgi:hypothetical protein
MAFCTSSNLVLRLEGGYHHMAFVNGNGPSIPSGSGSNFSFAIGRGLASIVTAMGLRGSAMLTGTPNYARTGEQDHEH